MGGSEMGRYQGPWPRRYLRYLLVGVAIAMQVGIRNIKGVSPPNSGICLKLEVSASGNEDYNVFGYSVSLNACGVDIGTNTNFRTSKLAPGIPYSVPEAFRIDPYLMHVIEEARSGKDLPLKIVVTLLMSLTRDPPAITHGGILALTASVPEPGSKISQADWAEIVKAMGYGNRAIIEIPFGEGPISADVQSAASYVQEARALFEEGKTDDVVAKCRKALEALSHSVSVNSGSYIVSWGLSDVVVQAIDRGSPGEPSRPSKSKRISELTSSFWNYLHIGPHENYQVFREDAEMALGITSMVVRYYSLQLNKASANP